jgi:hypothetical protein
MLSIVNPNAAGASYENGILTLRLPKTQAARARQLPIRTASQLESGPVQTPGQIGQAARQTLPQTPIQG